jgi:hypothetical protein
MKRESSLCSKSTKLIGLLGRISRVLQTTRHKICQGVLEGHTLTREMIPQLTGWLCSKRHICIHAAQP